MHQISPLTVGKFDDFLRLPTGDFIRPRDVEAIRLNPDKADRRTGEVGTKVYVQHRNSWFTISFEHADQAATYADALGTLCDRVSRGDVEPNRSTSLLGRAAAQGLIDGITNADGHDAPEEDREDED